MNAESSVLILGLSQLDGLRQLASRARLVVGVGPDDDVLAARRAYVDLDNVMFTPGSRDAIPWGDAHFTALIDLESGAPTAEMLRVLKRDGLILRSFQEAASS